MKQTMNILCATDKNFVPYCGIMLTSIFENNQTESVYVFIVVDESVGKKEEEAFEKLAKKYCQCIDVIHVNSARFDKYPVSENWSKAMYYRLLAAELLPPEIDKVIYFDCDIIVTGSLREMWNIDMDNYAIGAVVDAYAKDLGEYRDLSNAKEYFNSGSVIINLKYWRKYQLGEQMIQYLSIQKDKLCCPDQDVLNYVLQKHKLMLPVKYNFQIQFLKYHIFNTLNNSLKKDVLSTPPCGDSLCFFNKTMDGSLLQIAFLQRVV